MLVSQALALVVCITIYEVDLHTIEKRYTGKQCRKNSDCDSLCDSIHGGCDDYEKTCKCQCKVFLCVNINVNL